MAFELRSMETEGFRDVEHPSKGKAVSVYSISVVIFKLFSPLLDFFSAISLSGAIPCIPCSGAVHPYALLFFCLLFFSFQPDLVCFVTKERSGGGVG